MKKRKLRVSRRNDEISKTLSAAKDYKKNFAWKMIKGKRHTFPITILALKPEDNRIEISFDEDSALDLNAGDDLYLKLEAGDMAFKATVKACRNNRIALDFPSEMVLNENRLMERHLFHPTDEKYVSASKSGKLHHLLVLDLSNGGFCVFIPKRLHQDFDVKQKLRLKRLGDLALAGDVEGEIVFKVQADVKGGLAVEPGYKIGVKLNALIPKEMIERFATREMPFTISDEKIVRDQEFRKKVFENATKVRKGLSRKKDLKLFFDVFDRPDSDSQYLKHHIQMLCEVLSGLGTRLGWVSDKTIDKLIYVAYLHDIRFTECPKVARIPTLKKFNEIKDTLTAKERAAFLEAPAYAAELARRDSASYPDAIKILAQQKELPDGSGFPGGLTVNHIMPLSCLFIVSHFFVDYVIETPYGNVKDFVAVQRKKLKGPYFTKILQAMLD